MSSIKNGDTVTINYVGKLENGQVFATTNETVAKEEGIYSSDVDYKPFTFTVGEGQTIAGVDEGIVGMAEGEQKEIKVPPEKGFGLPDERLIRKIEMEAFERNQIKPKKGMVIRTQEGSGLIVDVQPDFALLDFNHPLSGRTLVFEVTVEDVAKD